MQKREKVDVSVVVPCRNEIRHIMRFLDSVFQQETAGLIVEILIADGMSDDGTREILDQCEQQREGNLPALCVINNSKQIASAGLNTAIRAAQGEIIIRMDVHTEYATDYIRNCVRVLNETKADNVGGPALTRADGYLSQAIALAFHSRFACGGAKFHNARYEGYVDTVTYGCWKRSTLNRVGLFDEQLYRNQDGDLNLRLISSGGKIWQSPKIISWYRPRTTLPSLFHQYFQYGFWKMRVIRKHRGLPAWRNVVPGACLLVGFLLLLVAAGAGFSDSVWWKFEFLKVEMVFAGLYVAACVGAALGLAWRSGWRFMPVLPIVFVTYHLSYGLGSLLSFFIHPDLNRPSYIRKVLTTITR